MINGLQPEIKDKVVDKDPGTHMEVMRQAIMAEAVEKWKQTAQINLIEEAPASHISTANEATNTRGSPSMEWHSRHDSRDRHGRRDSSFHYRSPSCNQRDRYSCRFPSRDSRDLHYRSPSHDRG